MKPNGVSRKHPAIEAHRGDSANAPENTLAAFRQAIQLRVPWIELDIHPSRDGVLMVVHDDRVDRTTNGSGDVVSATARELQRLDAGSWFGPPFAGERIPLLSEVVELVASTGTKLNVEIKASPPGMNVPQTLVALLRRFEKLHEYVISSFDVTALRQVQQIAPEATLALIGDAPGILPQAQDDKLPWIHVRHETLNVAVIEAAHAHGIRVNTWTVDDPEMLAAWQGYGLDKVCTNRPGRMLSQAKRTGQCPVS